MSHRFKYRRTPTFYTPERCNRAEAELRKMAACFENQAQLETIIAQTGAKLPQHQREEMQRRCLERIRPFLKFRPTRLSIFPPTEVASGLDDEATSDPPAETYCAERVSGA